MFASKAPADSSAYYPPRARWYGRAAYLWSGFWWRMGLDRLQVPKQITPGKILLSLFVPGLGFYYRGPKVLGRVALLGSALCLLVGVVWLGYSVAALAWGLMMTINILGFVYYCGLFLGETFKVRFFCTLFALVFLGGLFYLPLGALVQRCAIMPVTMKGQVVVINRASARGEIRVGDWMAFQLAQHQADPRSPVRLRSGMGLGPVLAKAGDVVEFSPDSFKVNGISRKRSPSMPVSGALTIPENRWLVWPNLDMRLGGGVNETVGFAAILEMAQVERAQFLGKPFASWCGRSQDLL